MIVKMAFRNIFRQKRRTILTAMSMIGGFAMAAIFIGWADGSYGNIIDNFTRYHTGHIQVHESNYLDRPSLYKTVDQFQKIDSKLKKIDMLDSWAPRVYSAGLVSVREKSTGAKIIGIDPKLETRTTSFPKKVTEGSMIGDTAAGEVLIGKGMASILKAKLGDDIVIVSQGADGSIANDSYKIIGLVDSGDEMADRMAFYLHIDDAQELLVLGERIHEIAITVHDLDDVAAATSEVGIALNNDKLIADPWQVFARSFYIAMKADMEGMWISLFIIVLIVAVGVLNTVLMSVLERTREYGVLKAMGTQPTQIIKLILTEVNILAFGSVIVGIGLGLLANYYLSQTGITLAEPLSYGGMEFKVMKSEINLRSFVIPAITIFLSASFVGLFPALKAAHTDPARSMRTH
jgi:ABC-type lipoprotein release transport system permease subunit